MITIEITIKGLVQGIGYRPFVAELAEKLHIRGWVRNTAGIVTILAEADEERLEEFKNRLISEAPKGAHVTGLSWKLVNDRTDRNDFIIASSRKEVLENQVPFIPADLCTCPRCEEELYDEKNRRYRHPFISCVACGPRYSILRALPYDRETITMGDFTMCPECGQEYTGRGNIRRHAQTIACKSCGPTLRFQTAKKEETLAGEDAFKAGAELLKAGGILAVKDVGGYHLACLPDSDESAALLRLMKGREKKPFAVMFSSIDQIKKYCEVNEQEQSALESCARPIVLLKRKKPLAMAENVCRNSPYIGAMLPCNPLQILLVKETGPLVMTSANRSGELMITENDDMMQWAVQIRKEFQTVIGILSHDRKILVPLDDSVVRIVQGRRQIFRRARGFVPEPVGVSGQHSVLAMGGDLKACFSYTAGQKAILSGHLGDLEDEACYTVWKRELPRMKQLFGMQPEAVVTDLHPGYYSGQEAERIGAEWKLPVKPVQHHMAHVASVIAEHQLTGPVFGVAMDGTGYGTDQTVWGGEFFLWDNNRMSRIGHLKSVALPGGNAGARNAESILYGYLTDIGLKQETLETLFSCAPWLSKERYELVRQAVSHQINVVRSSSMGRLFDAVSALLGVCLMNDYEGEAPMELEYLADTAQSGYPLHITIDPAAKTGDTSALFEAMIAALRDRTDRACLAKGFIDAAAVFIYDMVKQCAAGSKVVLSGGTFQNKLLLERVIALLEADAYQVFINEQVPCGDGGICIGQAYLYEHMGE